MPQWEQAERAPGAGKGSGEGKGGYRTVCVRTCDGYYWPISANVSKSRFYRDSNICRSSCGSEAKLFYQSASSGDAKSLIDLQGRPYSRMQTAFVYRKSLVQGCACKEAPWSQAEMDRHFQYAVAAGAPSAGSTRTAPIASQIVAGGYGGSTASPVPDEAPSAQPAAAEPVAEQVETFTSQEKVTSSATESKDVPRATGPVAAKSRLALSSSSRKSSAVPGQSGKAPTKRKPSEIAQVQPAPATRKAKPPQHVKARASSAQSASLFSAGGQAKYAWPGDTPTRYR